MNTVEQEGFNAYLKYGDAGRRLNRYEKETQNWYEWKNGYQEARERDRFGHDIDVDDFE
ncbi:hypothetical protein H1O16_gp420 [Burkholderia phage BcepSaruman]|uniref:Uncharacterized protein n=1 Tax=Burkholderia phage BcepSaruman TaxID=2530032 RepID=A0A4D5ZCQ6_9CAUD|nr:hypothetical protein H1O16_gp420 [Burkholderia phage BcepSaruman]QBX06833.1 hypothetical protein BcepSaruman_420 [Burkholderia phage BcepSaruman]